MYSWGDKLTAPSTYNPEDFSGQELITLQLSGLVVVPKTIPFTYRDPDRMQKESFPIIPSTAIILQPAIQHLYSTIK